MKLRFDKLRVSDESICVKVRDLCADNHQDRQYILESRIIDFYDKRVELS